MSLYFIHKLQHQEMGSKKNLDDKSSRGRYIYISKKCLDYFPHISSVVMNDKIILPIIPMREGENERKVYCTMDYHNQKFAVFNYSGKHPRNEYRIYMNEDIDPNRNFFVEGDFAVFEKFEVKGETIYSLTRISPVHEEYEQIRELVEANDPHYKSTVIAETEFDFILKPNFENIMDVVFTKDAKEVIKNESASVLDKESEERTEEKESDFEDDMGSSFFNSVIFRDLVMNAYQYKCAITGKAIRYKDLLNLETAHIKAKAHQGTYLPCNGIAMSRDMHFAFDKGFFTITDDYKVMVSENLKDDWFYKEYNGKEIFVPKEDFFKPNKEYLAHHRREVFNTFKQIRQLPK